MYSRPAAHLADSPLAREARDLIRSCVHCGFCLPACPTYRITGNELDSPRGRIYLVKELLESGSTNATARTHLDRCLTCRACESACPVRGAVRAPRRSRPRTDRAATARAPDLARTHPARSAARHRDPSRALHAPGACGSVGTTIASPRPALDRAATRAACRCIGPRYDISAAWPSCRAACSPDSRRRSMPLPHASSTVSASHWSKPRGSVAVVRWTTISGGPLRHSTRRGAMSRPARACSTAASRRSSARRAAAASSPGTTSTRCVTSPQPHVAEARRVAAGDPRPVRGDRPGGTAACPRAQDAASASRLAGAVLAAARATRRDGRQGRGAAARGGLRTRAGPRCDALLRLGRDLLDPAAGTVAGVADPQARCTRRPGDPT